MEQKKRKTTRRCNQRLLVLFFLFFFAMLCSSLASQDGKTAIMNFALLPYKIEKQHPESMKLGLHEMLFLSFKIDAKLKRAPQVFLESPYLKLQQSRVYQTGESTIIEVQYKLLNAGHIKVEPVVIIDGVQVKQELVEVFVLPPPLSTDAQFRARFFAVKDEKFISIGASGEDGQIWDNVYTLIKGEKYLLAIEGFFKSEDGDEVSVKYSTDQASDSKGFIEDGFFVEEICEKDLQGKEKDSVFSSIDGWQLLQALYFYPLKKGKLEKIEWNIRIKRKNGNFFKFTLKNMSSIIVIPPKAEIKERTAEDIFQQKFKQQLNEYLDKSQNEDKDSSKQLELAFKIRSFREDESRTWFAYEAKNKRVKLEEELGFLTSFEPFNYKWFILKISLSLLLIFSSFLSFIILYFTKRKVFNLLNMILAIVGVISFLFGIWNADFLPEYTHVGNEKLSLYSFPSKDASQLGEVKIGETVKILNKHKEWSFVEKSDYKRGWMK